MATFHLTAKVHSRSSGASIVAKAAYRACSKLTDEAQGASFSYENKGGLLYSEVMLPAGARDDFADRSVLWNEVNRVERRKDAELAREVEFMLPREMSDEANIALARSFVAEAFLSHGMVADLNIHKPIGKDGLPQPHAHVLLSTRNIADNGSFGLKNRTWRSKDLLLGWRELLATRTNEALAREGIESRIDHRSHAERGINLQPQSKIGWAALKMEAEGRKAARAEQQRATAGENGKRLIANPWLGLDALTEHQSTFSKADVARFVSRNTKDEEQFRTVFAKLMADADLVALGPGKRGEERYTTRHMQMIERRMASNAAALASTAGHRVRELVASDTLGPEQRKALEHVVTGGDLRLVTGYAGTGKSRMLGSARETWERAGYRVRGAALSGIAAENLHGGSGIESRTIASWEWAWQRDREKLTNRDVLVVDEAGMVDSRQMDRLAAAAKAAGAKLVLVGDPEQLQAIGAGAAFRALAERHGIAELSEVRRQRAKWMQEATKEFATARTAQALARYDAAGMVHASDTREQAMEALIAQWNHDRREKPERSQLILAYTRDDVLILNALARERMREAGALGEDVMVQTERGKRKFAPGERVMFLKNDRGMGVKNGTLGVLRGIENGQMSVQLDDHGKVGAGQMVSVNLREYTNLEHGYATTIHKSQGATVSRTKVMASRAFDRHATYVAASRHRGRMDIHFGRDEFADKRELAAKLGRERAKDTVLDYGADGPQAATQRRALMERAAQEAVRRMHPTNPERYVGGARERGEAHARKASILREVGEQLQGPRPTDRMRSMAKAVAMKLRQQRERSRDSGRGL